MKLFKTAISLIFKPTDAWRDLSIIKNDNHDSFITDYVFPFVGLIILATFISVLFYNKEMDIQIALKESIVVLLSLLGGFWLSSYLVNEVWRHIMHREQNLKLCQCFVGYSSSLMYCLTIVLCLIPEFFFIRFFILYTIYIVWEGATCYMEVNETEQLKFVSIATFIIIVTPLTIEFIIGFLMPGLRF